MGARAYRKIIEVVPLDGVVVEIGSDRGEGSTEFIAGVCLRQKVPFFSVDFNKKAFGRAESINGVIAHNTTGEHFLRKLFPKVGRKIAFAYLDGFDYTFPGMKPGKVAQQANTYSKYGFELTNFNSMFSHLTQSQLIVEHAASKCFIVIDDTWTNGTCCMGKGALAVPFLLESGFNILECGNVDNIYLSYVFLGRKLDENISV